MGLFSSSAKKKERKEAQKALKNMERNRRSKISDQRAVDPSKAITELQPCGSNLLSFPSTVTMVVLILVDRAQFRLRFAIASERIGLVATWFTWARDRNR